MNKMHINYSINKMIRQRDDKLMMIIMTINYILIILIIKWQAEIMLARQRGNNRQLCIINSSIGQMASKIKINTNAGIYVKQIQSQSSLNEDDIKN
jgi:uncharacterized membrane protein (DUF485 family)